MSIKVTFEFETPEAAAAFLMQDSNVDLAREEAAKPKRKPKDAPAAPAPTTGTAASAPAATSAVASTVPFKDVADAVTKLADIDTPKAKEILKSFGAAKATELKPEQYGAVVEAFNKAMAPSPTSSLI